jgi:hypothetical protein
LRFQAGLVEGHFLDRRQPENKLTGHFLAEQLQVELDQRRSLPFKPLLHPFLLLQVVEAPLDLAQVGQQAHPGPTLQPVAPLHFSE